ncbi:hypothetical protein W97_05173 [Coniosporium apollinis CBS 100218]|uniref:Uncharacterized protein n=1 Tax=Coniosporium apollinis (strain CBS 100218) TaxID=1168221 RepID=R7YW71_CONA1|nr:uncharacterized protein W97_05173 [Coniosporium apollinis CBS 100218]EON65931.1 hypothetical protein W97_05173 [Coniosporium apollinis CBS 100218]
MAGIKRGHDVLEDGEGIEFPAPKIQRVAIRLQVVKGTSLRFGKLPDGTKILRGISTLDQKMWDVLCPPTGDRLDPDINVHFEKGILKGWGTPMEEAAFQQLPEKASREADDDAVVKDPAPPKQHTTIDLTGDDDDDAESAKWAAVVWQKPSFPPALKEEPPTPQSLGFDQPVPAPFSHNVTQLPIQPSNVSIPQPTSHVSRPASYNPFPPHNNIPSLIGAPWVPADPTNPWLRQDGRYLCKHMTPMTPSTFEPSCAQGYCAGHEESPWNNDLSLQTVFCCREGRREAQVGLPPDPHDPSRRIDGRYRCGHQTSTARGGPAAACLRASCAHRSCCWYGNDTKPVKRKPRKRSVASQAQSAAPVPAPGASQGPLGGGYTFTDAEFDAMLNVAITSTAPAPSARGPQSLVDDALQAQIDADLAFLEEPL